MFHLTLLCTVERIRSITSENTNLIKNIISVKSTIDTGNERVSKPITKNKFIGNGLKKRHESLNYYVRKNESERIL